MKKGRILLEVKISCYFILCIHRTTNDVICFISKIAILCAAIAFVISSRCFPSTPERQQTVIQNDFPVRFAEIESMSRYAHTSCWPRSLRPELSLLLSPLSSRSLSLYLSRYVACINMRRCTRLVTLYASYMDVAPHEAGLRSRRRMNFEFRLHHARFSPVSLKLFLCVKNLHFNLFIVLFICCFISLRTLRNYCQRVRIII